MAYPPAMALLFTYWDDIMENELRDILCELIEEALTGEPITFDFIKSVPEFLKFQFRRLSLRGIVKVLSSCSKKLFKAYCSDILSGTQQSTKLIACITIDKAVAFYKRDLRTVEHMLGEYESYLMSGNQLDFLLFRQRKDSKLVDYRRL